MKELPFSDFDLIRESEVFPVHRFKFATRSPAFKAMFNVNFDEGKKTKAEIEDVDPKTLRTALNFIYTDKISNDDISPALLAAADKYNLKTLFNKCEQRLWGTITVGIS